uniref:Uncharacterized protein n=1 Tax=Setaria viridis TaxID=4556 RepID=A0A4U6VQ01_SETVI|nr:hypothetical protein SEVIR_2G064050v2 [Setaria viridis]
MVSLLPKKIMCREVSNHTRPIILATLSTPPPQGTGILHRLLAHKAAGSGGGGGGGGFSRQHWRSYSSANLGHGPPLCPPTVSERPSKPKPSHLTH